MRHVAVDKQRLLESTSKRKTPLGGGRRSQGVGLVGLGSPDLTQAKG